MKVLSPSCHVVCQLTDKQESVDSRYEIVVATSLGNIDLIAWSEARRKINIYHHS